MSTETHITNRSEFNLATAALEHLDLLNHSNLNPLEIAAQFRTLLRSNKTNKSEYPSTNDSEYLDYIAANTMTRKRSRSFIDHRWKVPYETSENQNYSKAIPRHPSINWKQLREKQYGYKLDKVKEFLSTKVRMTTSTGSFATVSDHTTSWPCSSASRSSSSNSIRTPSISPINTISRSTNYTISRMTSATSHSTSEEICFPIADCHLMIKHQPIE